MLKTRNQYIYGTYIHIYYTYIYGTYIHIYYIYMYVRTRDI